MKKSRLPKLTFLEIIHCAPGMRGYENKSNAKTSLLFVCINPGGSSKCIAKHGCLKWGSFGSVLKTSSELDLMPAVWRGLKDSWGIYPPKRAMLFGDPPNTRFFIQYWSTFFSIQGMGAHQRGDRRVAPSLRNISGKLQERFPETFLKFSWSIPRAVLTLSSNFPEAFLSFSWSFPETRRLSSSPPSCTPWSRDGYGEATPSYVHPSPPLHLDTMVFGYPLLRVFHFYPRLCLFEFFHEIVHIT